MNIIHYANEIISHLHENMSYAHKMFFCDQKIFHDHVLLNSKSNQNIPIAGPSEQKGQHEKVIYLDLSI